MSTTTLPFLNVGPYQEVINGIGTVFSFSDGVAKLTGPLGAGKTTVLKELIKELRAEDIEVVEYVTPPKSPEDLQSSLIRRFRLGADLSFRKSLIRHFANKPRDAQRLILAFDDAEQFTPATLMALHSLRERNSNLAVSLLLCGDKTLNALLNQPDLAPLQADISLNYVLSPLEDDTLSEFCSAYLQFRGKGRVSLSLDYLGFLFEQSRGLPEPLLQHLDLALQDPQFVATHTRREAPPVVQEPALLGQVIHNITEQINNIPPETKRWLKPTSQVLFTAAALSTVYVYYPRAVSMYQDFFGGGTTSAPVDTAQLSPPATEAVTEPAAAAAPAVVEPSEQLPAAEPLVATVAAEPNSPGATARVTSPVTALQPASPSAAPAVAATATAAPTLTPASAAAPAAGGDLEQVVQNWAAAWRSQDTQSYLGYYHTDFAPLYHPSRSAWRADRINSVRRPARIELAIRDLVIGDTDATGTKVQFRLDYQSATYADTTVKELVIGRDLDGQLRILRELNREVQTLPANQRLAAVPAATTPAAAAPAPATTPTSGQVASAPAATAASLQTMTRIGEPLMISANPQLASIGGRDAINEFIGSWLSAWQHKDIDGYFRHYRPGFVGPATASHDAWRVDRTVKITRPAVIQLHLVSLELVEDNTDSPLLRLALEYHSTYYADRTVKEVRLRRREDGTLEIEMERNTNVETLPLVRLLPSNAVAFNALARSLAEHRL